MTKVCKSKRRKVDIQNLLKKIQNEFLLPFSKLDPIAEVEGEDGEVNLAQTKYKPIAKCDNSSGTRTTNPKSRAEVVKLFQEIDSFCKISLPSNERIEKIVTTPSSKVSENVRFSRRLASKRSKVTDSNEVGKNRTKVVEFTKLDPIQVCPSTNLESTIRLPETKWRASKCDNDKFKQVQNYQPHHLKSNVEVSKLFDEIDNFCKPFSLPFKLGSLDQLDRLEQSSSSSAAESVSKNDKIELKPEIVKINQNTISNTRSSQRLASKSKIEQENRTKSSSTTTTSKLASYTNWLFNFKSSCSNRQQSNAVPKTEPPKPTKLRQPRSRKVVEKSTKTTMVDKNKVQLPPLISNQPFFNLQDSISFCRNFKRKIIEEKTEKLKNDQLKKQKKSSKKLPSQSLSSSSSSGSVLDHSDLVESGYSSGQSSCNSSSIPSPISNYTLNSNRSSSASSVASSYESSSYYSNLNPDGRVVYLRSHLDYYANKAFVESFRKSNNKNKSNRSSPFSSSSKFSDISIVANSPLSLSSPASPNITNIFDNNQKVLEWRTRTLFNSPEIGCPTPKHEIEIFDAETPPQSPQEIVKTSKMMVAPSTVDDDNFLDLDCFENFENFEQPQPQIEHQQQPLKTFESTQNELDLLMLENYENFYSKVGVSSSVSSSSWIDDNFSDIFN